jgi:hypothetical protein
MQLNINTISISDWVESRYYWHFKNTSPFYPFCREVTPKEQVITAHCMGLCMQLPPVIGTSTVWRRRTVFLKLRTQAAQIYCMELLDSFLGAIVGFVKMLKIHIFLVWIANLAAKLLSLPSVLQNRLQNILLEC